MMLWLDWLFLLEGSHISLMFGVQNDCSSLPLEGSQIFLMFGLKLLNLSPQFGWICRCLTLYSLPPLCPSQISLHILNDTKLRLPRNSTTHQHTNTPR